MIAANPAGKFGVYGFSLGAQTANKLLADPDVKRNAQEVTTIGAHHAANLENLENSNWNNYPDNSSMKNGQGNKPRGEGFALTGPHMTGPGAVASSREKPGTAPGVAAGAPDPNTMKFHGFQPSGGYQTAEQAGIRPEFPVGKDVTWELMDAETLSRFNAAYRAMPEKEKEGFSMTSGYRPAWRKEAEQLGLNPHTSQEDVWERHAGIAPTAPGYGRPSAAAKPGHSYHEGLAGDFTKTDWMRAHGGDYGLTDIGAKFDYPHIQKVKGDKRDFLKDEPRAANTPDGLVGGSPIKDLEPHKVRTTIDKSLTEDSKKAWEAHGKLTVDVNAPAGTKVRAHGMGAFSQTEIKRRISAEETPKQKSGGASVAGAGTAL